MLFAVCSQRLLERGKFFMERDDPGGSGRKSGVVPIEAVFAVIFCGFADGAEVWSGFGGGGREGVFSSGYGGLDREKTTLAVEGDAA